MNMLSVFAALINPPAIQHDSDGEIIIPLDYEVADEERDCIEIGEIVVFEDEVGRVYRGTLIDKNETITGHRWGLVHYRYQWGEVIHVGYSWQPSEAITAADEWDAQFMAVAL